MVAPSTKTSSTSSEPTVAKPEPVIVVTPDNAPLVNVAVPSVILPLVISSATAVSYTHLTLPTN